MADASYQPKVYVEQGASRQVIKSGGSLDVESGGEIDIESGGSLKFGAVAVTGGVQELTVSGAVTAGIQSVELNHASVVVAATIADLSNHQGFLMVKDTSASGTAAHTCTASAGTWDGTNTVVTLNASNEAILVYIDSAGDGTIIENVGGVVLS